MLMSNLHIDLVVVFGVEYLLVWLLPELVPVGFFPRVHRRWLCCFIRRSVARDPRTTSTIGLLTGAVRRGFCLDAIRMVCARRKPGGWLYNAPDRRYRRAWEFGRGSALYAGRRAGGVGTFGNVKVEAKCQTCLRKCQTCRKTGGR